MGEPALSLETEIMMDLASRRPLQVELYRLDPLFQDADLAKALAILLADPERFLGPRQPGRVSCMGRRADGFLCERWFDSPDVRTQRRCPECHEAEVEEEIEGRRIQGIIAAASEAFDREPTPEELIEEAGLDAELELQEFPL